MIYAISPYGCLSHYWCCYGIANRVRTPVQMTVNCRKKWCLFTMFSNVNISMSIACTIVQREEWYKRHVKLKNRSVPHAGFNDRYSPWNNLKISAAINFTICCKQQKHCYNQCMCITCISLHSEMHQYQIQSDTNPQANFDIRYRSVKYFSILTNSQNYFGDMYM